MRILLPETAYAPTLKDILFLMMRIDILIIIFLLATIVSHGQWKNDRKEAQQVIVKHFSWYFATVDSDSYRNYVNISNNSEGVDFLDASNYINELRSLGTVSVNFLQSESRRTEACNYLLKNIKKNDNFDMDIHRQCDFVYFYFWQYGNRAVNGVRISSVKKKRKQLVVEAILQSDNIDFNELLISLSKPDRHWLIETISKK